MIESRRRWLAVAAVVLIGLAATAIAWRIESARAATLLRDDFDSAASELTVDLANAFSIYEYGLLGARGAVVVADNGDIDRPEFDAYSATLDIEEEFPGARGFGFARKVPIAETDEYVANAQVDNSPTFSIKEIEPNDGTFRYVVEFIRPLEPNVESIGLDVASEERRRAAADIAAATGEATLSAPLTLVQATEQPEQGFLLLLPVYEPGAPLDTPAEREAATVGWTFAPLVTSEVLATINPAARGLAYSLTATLPAGGQQQEFYRSPDFSGEGAEGLETTESIQIFGTTWTMRITATDGFVAAAKPTTPPIRVALIGLLATLVAALITWSTVTASYRREHDRLEREQRLISEVTAREEQRLKRIVASTNAGTWEWNVQTGEVRFNERWAEIVGYTLAELEPISIDTWAALSHPGDLHASEQALQRHFDGETDFYDIEVRMRHKDGHWIWVSDRGQLVTRTADGDPEWMYGTHIDITTRHELARQLTESRSLLERAGAMARIGGWRMEVPDAGSEPADVPITWTSTTFRLHEVPDSFQPTLASAVHFYTPESQTILSGLVEHALETGEGWEQELQLRTWNGRVIWARTLGEVERDDDGQIVALFGVFQDIDDQKRMEQDLRSAKQLADVANDAKSRFLANTSHEIRTPLNALVGLTYLLRESELTPHQRELLAKIGFAADSLAAVINDVLDLSKIESGEMTLEETPLNFPELLAQVVAILSPTASDKGVDLRLELGDNLPALVAGDETRLRQIATNLVGNAIKFTDAGGEVVVSLRCLHQSAGSADFKLVVADTGIGISADAQDRLFDPFTQADSGTTRTHGGTGLGLSIVKRVVDMMAGNVGVESELGKGSSFWVDVSLKRPSPAPVGMLAENKYAMGVLVASPDETELRGLVQLSEAMGWRVNSAHSATEVADDLDSLADSGQLPRVIIIRSPLLDGASGEAIRNATERLGDARRPSFVVMVDPVDDQGPPPGFVEGAEVLHLPLSTSTLFNAVSQAATGLDVESRTQDRFAGTTSLRGLTIGVVDDSALNLLVAQQILELHGAKVRAMDSGREVLELLSAEPLAVDAVLLDLQMPDIDGIEVARRIRADLRLTQLPIIALTADALVSERDAALTAGMDAFLTKPFDPGALLATILELTGHVGAPVTPAPTPSRLPPISGVDDASSIAGIVSDDPAAFIDLLALLVSSNSPDRLREIAEQSDPVDQSELQSRLHKFRGSAASLGALSMAAIANDLESQIRLGTASEESLRAGLRRLAESLDAMADDVEAAQAARIIAPLESDVAPASEADLAHLRQLLAGHDLAALTWLESNGGPVRMAIGDDTFELLAEMVAALKFDGASALLN